jgi:hypothetical protein
MLGRTCFSLARTASWIVAVECRTHDRQVILPNQCSPDRLLQCENNVRSVSSLGQHICARTQLGDVLADGQYAVMRRILGASSH